MAQEFYRNLHLSFFEVLLNPILFSIQCRRLYMMFGHRTRRPKFQHIDLGRKVHKGAYEIPQSYYTNHNCLRILGRR